MTQIEDGLPLADIVPTDSFASPFLRDREKFYHDFSASLMVGMDRSGKAVCDV